MRRAVLLTSCSLFGFLIFCSPLISSILLGVYINFLFAGPLLASGLAALLSFVVFRRASSAGVIRLFNFLCVASIPLSLFLFKLIQQQMDKEAVTLAEKAGRSIPQLLVELGRDKYQFYALVALSIPFIFYGLFISLALRRRKGNEVIGLYLLEVLGINFGFILGAILLDLAGLKFFLAFLFFLGSLSPLFLRPSGRKFNFFPIFMLIPLGLLFFKPQLFEPSRNIHWSVQDFSEQASVEELASGWSSSLKFQTLRVNYPDGQAYQFVSFGSGQGRARVPLDPNFGEGSEARTPDTIASALKPQKVLVIFGGAGADLMFIKNRLKDVQVTAVEINSDVIRQGLNSPGSGLKEFLKRYSDTVKLVNEDGRAFLEQSKERYDLVLYSWSGTAIAYYSGAELGTAQYLYTKEALEQAMNHLRPNGHLIIMSAPKLNLILSLYDYFHGTEGLNLRSSMVLLSHNGHQEEHDDNELILVLKRGNFNLKEIERLSAAASEVEYAVEYSPFNRSQSERAKAIDAVVAASSFPEALKKARVLDPSAKTITDNSPILHLPQSKPILSLRFWKDQSIDFARNPFQLTKESLILFLISIILITLAAAAFYGLFSLLLIGGLLGFFSFSFSILILYKAFLYLGLETSSFIIIYLGALISSFLGGLCAYKNLFEKSFILWGLIALSFLILSFLGYEFNSPYLRYLLFQKKLGPTLLIFLLFLPVFTSTFIFCGLLRKVREKREGFVSLYYAVNTLAGAVAALLIPLAVRNEGFKTTANISISFALLGLVLILVFHLWSERRAG